MACIGNQGYINILLVCFNKVYVHKGIKCMFVRLIYFFSFDRSKDRSTATQR